MKTLCYAILALVLTIVLPPLDALGRLFAKPPSLSPRRRKTTLIVEFLEVRTVPATVNIWTNKLDTGDWNTADNWSLERVPTVDDIPTFLDDPAKPFDRKPCTIPVNTVVYGLDLQSSWGQQLTLGGLLEVKKDLTHDGGTIHGGTLRYFGEPGGAGYTWRGGTRSGGLTDVQGGLTLRFTSAATKTVVGTNYQVTCNSVWDGGDLTFDGAAFDLLGGTMTVNSGTGFTGKVNPGAGAAGGHLSVGAQASVVIALSNGQSVDVRSHFASDGRTEVNAGSLFLLKSARLKGPMTVAADTTLRLSTPGETVFQGTVISGAGQVELVDGPFKLEGTNSVVNLIQWPGARLRGLPWQGGQLPSSLNLGGAATLYGGKWNLMNVNVNAGATLTIPPFLPNDPPEMNFTALVNNGTVNLRDGARLNVSSGSKITNNNIFNIQGTGSIPFVGGLSDEESFENNRLLQKTGLGESRIDIIIRTQGPASLIQIDQGSLFHINPLMFTDGELFLNGGDLVVGGAGLTLGNELGLLRGSGTITAALVENRAGRIDQTGLTGYQTLQINGDYKEVSGDLKLKIGRPGNALAFDRLIVSGKATLGGHLTVQPAAGFAAQNGDAATILSFASRVGDFNAGTISIPNGMVKNPGAQTYVIQKLQPKINGMLPNAGPVLGGTLVTLTGEGFLGTTGVSFGGTPATSFTVVSDTELQAVSPAHGAGPVAVSVTSPNGTSDSSPGSVFTYQRVSTTTALSSSANPSSYGQSVTLTATVSPAQGFGMLSGTVTFMNGSTVLGTAPISMMNTASLTLSSLPAGTHSLTAVYGGDALHEGSTSAALTQTVNKAFAMTMLSSSQNPAPVGSQVTLTASVFGGMMGSPPTGTVEFWEVDPVTGANLALLGTATLDQYGQAVITWSSQTAGTRRVKALYLGDANYNSSFATFDQTFSTSGPPGSGSE